ncbi:hypothetical protein AUR04nite_00470 [Glutamicibacter uratoxydans]|uniref:Phage head morphogenesis domain-containing protein n=1 Tax=Glutamicibacter uratoxydans TaxID=43667 RepID=A0A4Y4DLJ1_GLUUR|nr:hypothetical protein [Glutamicibacter uratoxydans]GED04515.1 hypothetical protein AUR04nite_00470 [Glutamicibacter uratoxydans]
MARNELEATEEAVRAAQARLGLIGAYLALMQFTSSVGVLNPAATGVAWTTFVVKLVAGMRIRSRKLAKSYYQLARALDTGATLGVPEGLEPGAEVSLNRLRQQFLDELLEVNSLGREVADDADELARFLHDEALKASPDDDIESKRGLPLSQVELDKYIQAFLDHEGVDGRVRVEPFEWPTDTDFKVIESSLGDYLRRNLADLEGSLKAKVSEEREDPERREEELRQVHEDAGNKLAGMVHKQGISAGTDAIRKVSGVDQRVQAWARQTGPRPCSFCAMLASRGFVYKNAKVATKAYKDRIRSDGTVGFSVSAYHPNCACTAIPRWESTGKADLPELNAFLEEMWPKVTEGYHGVDALNAWRRWLNARYKMPDGQQSFDV